MTAMEVNFDGLVGPTHNYAGLSHGNVASQSNLGGISNPREAALQGLEKMRALSASGMVQGVLPPHARPHVETLKQLGFHGSLDQMLESAFAAAPPLLGTVMSASPMWTANAATVSPSTDTRDGRVHFTPANLVAMPHRSIEAPQTKRTLDAIFSDEGRFAVHAPLPHHTHFGDEGAANHTRLCNDYGDKGVEIFVYGQEAYSPTAPRPSRYPARQTLEASEAVARLHGLEPDNTVFVQQNPDVIDAGVFHNDVIAVGNGSVLFFHEDAFLNKEAALREISEKFGAGFAPVELPREMVSVSEAVSSYLFNSQLLSMPGSTRMTLIAPMEAHDTPAVKHYLDDLTASQGPIGEVRYFDLKQSMRNGGGPACLRLRVVLTDAERAAIKARVFMDDGLYEDLKSWVQKNYRDALAPEDLKDPQLAEESFSALDELTGIMQLGSIYPFQLT
ncbi:MAG: N-succinylarginine dihydrolase [Alphaproteobacteria bacterium]|nr:MAG: N-succinylarginine dihydrolase [Alphaproteobacteria bacterium]